jgi:hypothetical protein
MDVPTSTMTLSATEADAAVKASAGISASSAGLFPVEEVPTLTG